MSAPSDLSHDTTQSDDATTQPLTAHRLQLPRTTDPADVLTMIRNVRPEAALDGGVLTIGDGVRLVADESRRGAGRWTLEAPRERGDASQGDSAREAEPDSHGYGRAFPDGQPEGVELEALDLAWSLARRLFGAVVTEDGVRLEPHPCCIPDLAVLSPHVLAPESFAQLIAPLEPEATLDDDPTDAPISSYGLSIDLDEGGRVLVHVGRGEIPVALQDVPWADEAVYYMVVYEPEDRAELQLEQPDEATAQRWVRVYRRIGQIVGLVHETVGGFVVDPEGFLVDPAQLA